MTAEVNKGQVACGCVKTPLFVGCFEVVPGKIEQGGDFKTEFLQARSESLPVEGGLIKCGVTRVIGHCRDEGNLGFGIVGLDRLDKGKCRESD